MVLLFDAKQTQVNVVSPEVAECDMKLAELEQKKQDAIFRIGQLYVENNDAKSAEGTVYAELLKAVEGTFFYAGYMNGIRTEIR